MYQHEFGLVSFGERAAEIGRKEHAAQKGSGTFVYAPGQILQSVVCTDTLLQRLSADFREPIRSVLDGESECRAEDSWTL